jgi:hypothetical protein
LQGTLPGGVKYCVSHQLHCWLQNQRVTPELDFLDGTEEDLVRCLWNSEGEEDDSFESDSLRRVYIHRDDLESRIVLRLTEHQRCEMHDGQWDSLLQRGSLKVMRGFVNGMLTELVGYRKSRISAVGLGKGFPAPVEEAEREVGLPIRKLLHQSKTLVAKKRWNCRDRQGHGQRWNTVCRNSSCSSLLRLSQGICSSPTTNSPIHEWPPPIHEWHMPFTNGITS